MKTCNRWLILALALGLVCLAAWTEPAAKADPAQGAGPGPRPAKEVDAMLEKADTGPRIGFPGAPKGYPGAKKPDRKPVRKP
jgi:hypothetical protein